MTTTPAPFLPVMAGVLNKPFPEPTLSVLFLPKETSFLAGIGEHVLATLEVQRVTNTVVVVVPPRRGLGFVVVICPTQNAFVVRRGIHGHIYLDHALGKQHDASEVACDMLRNRLYSEGRARGRIGMGTSFVLFCGCCFRVAHIVLV